MALTSLSDNDDGDKENALTTGESVINSEPLERPLAYEVIYAGDAKRSYPGYQHYILIEPIDINEPEFKNIIKVLIAYLAKTKGTYHSFDIYDNAEAFEYGYLYDHGSFEEHLSLVADEDKLSLLVRHGIATFHGEMETMGYYNSLIFFGFHDQILPIENSPVYELAEVIEFNP